MAWERRGRGRRYYTRSTRHAGKVVREYVGRGAAGELAAAEDALRRAQRQAERAAWLEGLARLDGPAGLAEFNRACELLTSAALLADDCYRHYGTWRRRGRERHDAEQR
jgi:hypothetical protein